MTDPRTLLIARPCSDWSIQLSGDLTSTHPLPPNWTAITIPAALSQLGFEAPDLIVVIQETPDQFSNHDVQQLLGIWPLARLVVCYGTWCNGDGRTRDAWPQATRAFTFHVVSPDSDWSRTLADQLVTVGGHPSPAIHADTDLLLVDADPWDPGRLESLIQSTTPPVILLLTHTPHSIPRSDLDETLQAHPRIVRLEVHDKLEAATRPEALPTT